MAVKKMSIGEMPRAPTKVMEWSKNWFLHGNKSD